MLKPELSPQEIATALTGLIGQAGVILPERVELLDPGREDDNLDANVVAVPSSTEDVQKILTWCSAQGVSVITHGGRTSLAGDSVPDKTAADETSASFFISFCAIYEPGSFASGRTVFGISMLGTFSTRTGSGRSLRRKSFESNLVTGISP